MSVRTAFEVSLVVLAALLVALVGAVVLGRAVRQLGERRRRIAAARVRPLVLALLHDEPPERPLPTRGRDGRAVEAVVTSMLPKLRGVDRDALAQVLVDDGTIDRARRRLRSRRAVRRLAAAELLGRTSGGTTTGPDERSVPPVVGELLPLLADRDGDVRMAAARALGRLGHAAAVKPLVVAIDDRSVPANTASMALLRIGSRGSHDLLDMIGSEERALRPTTTAIVVEILGALGHVAATSVLEALLTRPSAADGGNVTGAPTGEDLPAPAVDPAVRRSAVRALGRLGVPSSSRVVMTVLAAELDRPGTDRDLDLCIACVTALGQLGDRRAIPLLTDSLARSHRLSYAAAQALAAMGPRRSRRSMRERTRNGTPATAPVAAILAARPQVPDGAVQP